ncbi:hypothetical protein B0A49_13001, partial [Cryomyces minteri]
MPQDIESANEQTALLLHVANDRRLSAIQQHEEASSIVKSHVTVEEQAMSGST